MKVAYTISGIGHAAVLLWSVWSLAAKPLAVPPSEALPVDIVSVSEFTQMTAGKQDAPKAETAKPLAEKVAEAKPVEDVTAKVVEKKEVKAAREPPPAPEAKPVETKPRTSRDEAGGNKPAEAKPEKKQAEAKPDPIAEALAKERKEPRSPSRRRPRPSRRRRRRSPRRRRPSSIRRQIQAKLLNKQDATRLAAAGPNSQHAAALARPAERPSEAIVAERARRVASAARRSSGESRPALGSARSWWSCSGSSSSRDGRLVEGPPQLVSSGKTPLAIAARESAHARPYIGQPFDMLRPENYELWKDIEIDFDPRDMFGGY